jgi:hypothetical protein
MSTELAEDAVISIADDLAQEMGYAFAVAEDAAGWTGDGTSTYGGIRGVKTKLGGTSSVPASSPARSMGLRPRHLRRDRRDRSGERHGEAAEVRRAQCQVVLLAAVLERWCSSG